MGELIVLAERMADRSRPSASTRPGFFFDLACPFSYLAAERVERIIGDVEWVPTAAAALHAGKQGPRSTSVRVEAERCAAELRLPLVWPEGFATGCTSALRAAAYAAEIGAGARFALAAGRLAFCGGFDLEDLEILAVAADAAPVPLDECLAAAGDPTRDGALHATARGLLAQGVRRLPAVRVGHRCFEGESAPEQAALLLRAQSACRSPLAPIG
jgi:2-hydroxychromene-2-carboxylate isomerase